MHAAAYGGASKGLGGQAQKKVPTLEGANKGANRSQAAEYEVATAGGTYSTWHQYVYIYIYIYPWYLYMYDICISIYINIYILCI